MYNTVAWNDLFSGDFLPFFNGKMQQNLQLNDLLWIRIQVTVVLFANLKALIDVVLSVEKILFGRIRFLKKTVVPPVATWEKYCHHSSSHIEINPLPQYSGGHHVPVYVVSLHFWPLSIHLYDIYNHTLDFSGKTSNIEFPDIHLPDFCWFPYRFVFLLQLNEQL